MPRASLTLPALLVALLATPAFADDDHDHDHDEHHEAGEEHADHDHDDDHDHDEHDHGDEDHADHDDHDHDDHDHGDEDHAGHDDHDHDHDDHAGHDHEHEHGHAMLSISIDGQLVEASLTVTGDDLFAEGADKSLDAATAIFESANLGLTLPEAAGCETITFDVTTEMVEEEGDHEGHADYSARRVSLCSDPDALDQIGVTAFTAMPSLEEIELSLDAPGFSLEAELEPGVTGILLAPPLSY